MLTVAMGLFCFTFFATDSMAKAGITFKGFGDESLCRALIVDEARLSNAPYGRDAIANPRNAVIPLGGEVVSMLNVDHDLEKDAQPMSSGSDEFHNAFVSVSHFDFMNSGKAQNVYHLYESNHYFDGDIFIVTGADVPETTVAAVIDDLDSSSGDLETAHDVAAAHGWFGFTGGEMFYRSTRYTTLAVFGFKGRTYLAATGLRPGPVAVILQPLPDGHMKDACLFYLN
jgi:hypothetical protein